MVFENPSNDSSACNQWAGVKIHFLLSGEKTVQARQADGIFSLRLMSPSLLLSREEDEGRNRSWDFHRSIFLQYSCTHCAREQM
ncbi:hypothetical protein COCON_G00053590 [Conger conger]|uniref:Uncharacterized protein n=1 Tax=Conger conger TaxID=82655 RepID=A0A9Q1I5T8_CONCO|nr:hypothetical protein COCON_G00053590 [Conger conger]